MGKRKFDLARSRSNRKGGGSSGKVDGIKGETRIMRVFQSRCDESAPWLDVFSF